VNCILYSPAISRSTQLQLDYLIQTTNVATCHSLTRYCPRSADSQNWNREYHSRRHILNHYLLTEKLIEKSVLKSDAVVINMSSGGMYNAPLMVDRMNVTKPERYSGVFAYAVHKRGQAELTKHWTAKYGARGMKFYVMHPGWADTAGVERSLPRFHRILNAVLRDGRQGTETAIWLAAARPDGEPGGFWFDRKIRTSHVFPATRNSKNTPADLADYLAKELATLKA